MIITTTETQTKERNKSRIILKPLKLRENDNLENNVYDRLRHIPSLINKKKSEEKNKFFVSNGFNRFKQFDLSQNINIFKNTNNQNNLKIISDKENKDNQEKLFVRKKKLIKPIKNLYNIEKKNKKNMKLIVKYLKMIKLIMNKK